MKRIGLIITYLTFCSSSLFAERISLYNFSSYKGMKCDEFLQETIEHLKQDYGIYVKTGLCEWSDTTRQTKITLLDEDSSVNSVLSTYSLGNIYAARGLYVNQETCEQNLETEARIFERLTSVSPQIKYCSYNGLEQKWKWSANLTALNGTPQRKPVRSEWRSGTPYGLSYNELLSKLQERMAPLGMIPYAHRFRSGAALGRGTIHHYQPVNLEYFSVHADNIVAVEGLENCKGIVDRLESEIAQSKRKPAFYLGFCSSQYSNPKTFDVTLVTGNMGVQTQYSSVMYRTLAECENGRRQIAENFELIYPRKLIATTCGSHPYSRAERTFYRVAILKNGF